MCSLVEKGVGNDIEIPESLKEVHAQLFLGNMIKLEALLTEFGILSPQTVTMRVKTIKRKLPSTLSTKLLTLQ